MKAILREKNFRLGLWSIIKEVEVVDITPHAIKIEEGWWVFKKHIWYPREALGMRFELIEEKK